MSAAKHTPGPCPYCATQMVNSGSPIWEDYCPNTECTGARDEMFRQVREASKAKAKADQLRDAAPDLLEALRAALEWIDAVPPETVLPTMPGFDRDDVNIIIAKAEGRT